MREFISCETVLDESNGYYWIDVESEILNYEEEYDELVKDIAFSFDYPVEKFSRLSKVEVLLHALDWIKRNGNNVVSLEYFNDISQFNNEKSCE